MQAESSRFVAIFFWAMSDRPSKSEPPTQSAALGSERNVRVSPAGQVLNCTSGRTT
jgi:hypothetical protein